MPLNLFSLRLSLQVFAVLTALVSICFVSLSGVCVADTVLTQPNDTTAEHDFENEDFTVAIGIENTIRLRQMGAGNRYAKTLSKNHADRSANP